MLGACRCVPQSGFCPAAGSDRFTLAQDSAVRRARCPEDRGGRLIYSVKNVHGTVLAIKRYNIKVPLGFLRLLFRKV